MSTSARTLPAQPLPSQGQFAAHYALLDPLRGLASLLVVFHHIPGQPLGRWAGEPGVMLFFVISGYCIAAAWHRATQRTDTSPWQSVGTFMYRRVRRIFPPWWAALLLWVAFEGFTRALTISPSTWALNASLLHWVHLVQHPSPSGSASGNPIAIMGIAWTLCYEEQYYAIMALLLITSLLLTRASKPWAQKACGVALACLVACSIAWVSIFPHRATGLILDCLPHFGVGLLLYLRLCVLPARWRTLGTLALIFAAAAALATHALCYPTVPFFADAIRRSKHVSRELSIGTSCGVLLLALRPLDSRWGALLVQAPGTCSRTLARALAFLGAISYSLYLTHTIPTHALQSLCNAGLTALSIEPTTTLATSMHVVLQVSAQLLLAAGFWWLVERHFVGNKHPPRPGGQGANPVTQTKTA